MTHYDCKYFLSSDVFKGICKLDKSRVIADDESCEKFEKAKKCKHCQNFKVTKKDLGLCMDKFDTFPELIAATCKDFLMK